MPGVLLSLTDDKHRIIPELTAAEIYAIGLVTVQWSYLEHLILMASIEMAKLLKIPLPPNVSVLSFSRRNAAFRELAKEAFPEGDQRRQRFLDFSEGAGARERSRHRIVHGIWDWEGDPEHPVTVCERPGAEFTEEFGEQKLLKLADAIGELCFSFQFPGGKDQFYEAKLQDAAQLGGQVSRLGALILMGKEPLILGHHNDKPQGSKE